MAHSWFNRFRKLLVRYEKTHRSYLALTMLAAAIIWLLAGQPFRNPQPTGSGQVSRATAFYMDAPLDERWIIIRRDGEDVEVIELP